jgi:hypothetical protein
MIGFGELERTGEERVVYSNTVLSQHSRGGTNDTGLLPYIFIRMLKCSNCLYAKNITKMTGVTL